MEECGEWSEGVGGWSGLKSYLVSSNVVTFSFNLLTSYDQVTVDKNFNIVTDPKVFETISSDESIKYV